MKRIRVRIELIDDEAGTNHIVNRKAFGDQHCLAQELAFAVNSCLDEIPNPSEFERDFSLALDDQLKREGPPVNRAEYHCPCGWNCVDDTGDGDTFRDLVDEHVDGCDFAQAELKDEGAAHV